MAYINLIKLLFIQFGLIIFILSALMNTFENYLPIFIRKVIRYGKLAYEDTEKSFTSRMEVPKSWFRHFYIYASVCSSIALYLVVNSYVFDNTVPNCVVEFLHKLNGPRNATVSPMATLLALFLITIHVFRRCYETQFISVYSKNMRLNLILYIVAMLHYLGITLAILLEAPNFTPFSNNAQLNINDIALWELVGIAIFFWSCWHQYKANVILGNLRKNANGKIVSNNHYIPRGDLFELISSPHITTEILIYLSLTLILWNNSTWWFVFIWVVTNQVESALLNHWWYEKTFPNYPKTRKILIPYIF